MVLPDRSPLFRNVAGSFGGIDERDHLVFNSGKAVAGYEEQITDQSGQERTFLTTKSPLRSPEGGVIAVLTTSLDISDRKQAEKDRLFLAEHDHLSAFGERHRGVGYEVARATDRQ